ncbi:hypothetical protein IVG45_01120 [Methylomonas sp. LL1]|uniref:hypothetical protein n=1 Tax=Methylomonas sp. LL1 TaxID=2785785 RepID=UPI0018C3E7A9|nr:hypothetical protein [Methylomonas sp. LL1]QPK63616.1 hypothetical protein IVG45_01120 [Methylomonas sp. LL1]
MSTFNSIVLLGALLASPMVASGSTTTSYVSGNATNLAPDFSYQGTGGSFVITPASEFSHLWELNVAEGETANLSFSVSPIYVSNFAIFDIAAGINIDSVSALLGLTGGPHSYLVSGVGTGFSGGAYSVGTEVAPVILPVPVPAAIWLMGSALVGWVSIGGLKKSAVV